MKKNYHLIILFSCIISIYPTFVQAKLKVLVAAASNTKYVMEELKSKFETLYPDTEIGFTFGSSGKFFEQIKNGAPFDIFFSADNELPQKLKESGIGSEVTPFAIGEIVLWSIKYKISGLEDLRDPKFKTIALANPKHAPYGVAALEALKKLGLYNSIQERIVLGENIAQTAQFVETGAADAGVIALSIVLAPNLKDKGFYKIIAKDLYTPLNQSFILLSKNNSGAKKFINFIKTKSAKIIFKKYGFKIPEKEI